MHLTSHGLLLDQRYTFCFSRSTVDVLITEFVYQALNTNDRAWAVALEISKAFNSVWNAGLLHKLYGVSGRIFVLIQSFFKKDLCNEGLLEHTHTSRSILANMVVPHGFILDFIFINHLPNVII